MEDEHDYIRLKPEPAPLKPCSDEARRQRAEADRLMREAFRRNRENPD
jgi:hypothetical protein